MSTQQVYFDGGPWDGMATTYETLLGTEHPLDSTILEYRWTDQEVFNTDGVSAVVWRHKSKCVDTGDNFTAEPSNNSTSNSHQSKSSTIEEPLPTPSQVLEFPDLPLPSAPDVNNLPNGKMLWEMRSKLNLTREAVANGTGLKTSKVMAIERETAKRAKPEEIQRIFEFLQQKKNNKSETIT